MYHKVKFHPRVQGRLAHLKSNDPFTYERIDAAVKQLQLAINPFNLKNLESLACTCDNWFRLQVPVPGTTSGWRIALEICQNGVLVKTLEDCDKFGQLEIEIFSIFKRAKNGASDAQYEAVRKLYQEIKKELGEKTW